MHKDRKIAIIISPNWNDYARRYLDDCFSSLRRQNWSGESKIFLIDNETTRESYNFLKNGAPDAEIIRNEDNLMFAGGNNSAMKVAINQEYDYIILFNMDTIVDSDCIGEMISVVESDEKIGAIQARLMFWPEKEKINSLGNRIHFLGFGYCQGYQQKVSDTKLQERELCYPSGAAVLFKADVLRRVGLFDEKFMSYCEDMDLGWRIRLAGFKCIFAPDAVVYHKFEFLRDSEKYYLLERNRVITLIKNYHLLTLLLIIPTLALMEVGILIFSFFKGWWREKIRSYAWFVSLKNWRYLINARREAQSLRKIKDKEIVRLYSGRIEHPEINNLMLDLINPLFDLYWKIIRCCIKW